MTESGRYLDAPQVMPEAFAEAWAARDADALAALFAADADFVNVTGLHWRTRDAIRRAHAYGFARIFGESRLTLGRITTRSLSDTAAVVHARITLDGQTARGGGTAGRRRTEFVFVMARAAAGWHCVAAQNTEILPGAETFEAGPDGLNPQDYR